jgi:ATP-binding cassette subfamily F protein 3
LIVFANDEAISFNGTYDEFLEKIGWDDDVVEVKKEKNVKVNKKESKKLRAAIVSEKSKATTPIKKQMQEIEDQVEKLEDALADARVKLSRDIPKIEKEIEDKFTLLEELQTKLDVMNKEFEIRMSEV